MASQRLMATIDLQDRLSAKLNAAARNVNNFADRVKDSENKMRGLETAAQRAGGALMKIGGVAVAAGIGFVTAKMVALKAAVTAVGASAWKTNVNIESMAMAMRVLYRGDTQAYAAQFRDIINFAQKSPFELPEIYNASIALKGLQMNINEWLPYLSDLAASTGGRANMTDAINSIRYIKSGIYGEGFESLGRVFNISRSEFKAQGLQFSNGNEYLGTADQALEALKRIMGQRGFIGLSEELATTSKGIISNLADTWTKLSMKLMGFDFGTGSYAQNSIYMQIKGYLKGTLDYADKLFSQDYLNSPASIGKKLGYIWSQLEKSLTDWYNGGGQAKVQAVATRIGQDLANTVMGLFGANGEGASIFGEIGGTAAHAFIEGFKKNFRLTDILNSDRGNALFKVLGLGAVLRFGPGLLRGIPSLAGGVATKGMWLSEGGIPAAASAFSRQGMTGGLTQLAQFGKVGQAISRFALPAAIGGMALDVALAKPKERLGKFADDAGGLMGGLMGSKIGATLGAALGTFVGPVGTAVGGALGSVIGGVVGGILGSKIVNAWRTGGIMGIWQMFLDLKLSIMGWIAKAQMWIVGAIGSLIAKLAGRVVGAVQNMFDQIREQGLAGFVKSLWDGIWNGLVGGFMSAIDKLKKWAQDLAQFGVAQWEKIKNGYVEGYQITRVEKAATQYHSGGLVNDEGWAILKRKEMVLDPGLSQFIRESASKSRNDSASVSQVTQVSFGSLVGTAYIREEADIQKLAGALAEQLQGISQNRGTLSLAGVAK